MGSGCVAQLVEQLLPIPEVRGSNPVIGKKILNICLLSTVYWKDNNKEKEAGNGPFLKNYTWTGIYGIQWSMLLNCFGGNIDFPKIKKVLEVCSDESTWSKMHCNGCFKQNCASKLNIASKLQLRGKCKINRFPLIKVL